MLCDHAQVADGKLFINGGGISRFHGPGLPPGTSIAVLMLIPWELTNAPIVLDLHLLTQDGQPVQDSEGADIGIQARTEVGRPPGIEPGIPIDLPLTFHVGGLRLPTGRYMWRLSVNNDTRQAWQLSLTVIIDPGTGSPDLRRTASGSADSVACPEIERSRHGSSYDAPRQHR